MATIHDLADYRGPLGAVEAQLARRRIAVATDRGGRISLVRPDSVVVEFDADSFGKVREVVTHHGLDVLGGMPEDAPRSGALGTRSIPTDRPARWSIEPIKQLTENLSVDGLRPRPNQVYLADGVGRWFGMLDEGSVGTPGLYNPASLESTVRPAAPPSHLPTPLGLPGHRPPKVLVLDTGLRTMDARAEHPELFNCVVHDDWLNRGRTGRWDDEDEPDDDHGGRLDYQAGHGTFISGIVRQLCPDAEIHHSGVLTSYGDGDDASVIAAIERALPRLTADEHYDVVVMSFGTYAVDDKPPPLADAVRLLDGCVLVASAGNDATSRPYFPAALPGVIGVGALDSRGRATFSNFGSWVNACAPGLDVVSTFFANFDERGRRNEMMGSYRGWATWSGTSFAAPKVAAMIAKDQYLFGGTATESWARLTDAARFRIPGLGTLFNV